MKDLVQEDEENRSRYINHQIFQHLFLIASLELLISLQYLSAILNYVFIRFSSIFLRRESWKEYFGEYSQAKFEIHPYKQAIRMKLLGQRQIPSLLKILFIPNYLLQVFSIYQNPTNIETKIQQIDPFGINQRIKWTEYLATEIFADLPPTLKFCHILSELGTQRSTLRAKKYFRNQDMIPHCIIQKTSLYYISFMKNRGLNMPIKVDKSCLQKIANKKMHIKVSDYLLSLFQFKHKQNTNKLETIAIFRYISIFEKEYIKKQPYMYVNNENNTAFGDMVEQRKLMNIKKSKSEGGGYSGSLN